MNSAKLVVAGADYFWDVSLHHQLTVEVNAEIVLDGRPDFLVGGN